MFRFTRPLLQAVSLKKTTGIHGLAVHPDPLPALQKTFTSTLSLLGSIPASSTYRQGVEVLTKHKLKVIEQAQGDITKVESTLNEGQVEEILAAAEKELGLVGKMIEWKAWEPLEEKPAPGQWEYFKD